jgi:hypothetical protein
MDKYINYVFNPGSIRILVDDDCMDKCTEQLSSDRLTGAAVKPILYEYGIVAHRCATLIPTSMGRTVFLRIVIDGHDVYFIPNKDTNEIAISSDSALKEGWVLSIYKEDIYDFSNIEARLDGWQLFTAIHEFNNPAIRAITPDRESLVE